MFLISLGVAGAAEALLYCRLIEVKCLICDDGFSALLYATSAATICKEEIKDAPISCWL
jgi:hypothetical protein